MANLKAEDVRTAKDFIKLREMEKKRFLEMKLEPEIMRTIGDCAQVVKEDNDAMGGRIHLEHGRLRIEFFNNFFKSNVDDAIVALTMMMESARSGRQFEQLDQTETMNFLKARYGVNSIAASEGLHPYPARAVWDQIKKLAKDAAGSAAILEKLETIGSLGLYDPYPSYIALYRQQPKEQLLSILDMENPSHRRLYNLLFAGDSVFADFDVASPGPIKLPMSPEVRTWLFLGFYQMNGMVHLDIWESDRGKEKKIGNLLSFEMPKIES